MSDKISAHTVNVEGGISDHKMVVVTVAVRANDCFRPYIPVRIKNYVLADDVSILDYLESVLDDFVVDFDTKKVEELWQYFKFIVQHCVDSYIPTRVNKNKAPKPLDNQRYNSEEKKNQKAA